MKNTFAIAIIIIVSLITSFSVKAQHGYRGFVDAQLGVVASDYQSGISGGISTIHGYQLAKSFLGVGIGIDGNSIYTGHSGAVVPIFAQYRYDYSLVSNHSFYAMICFGRTIYDPTAYGAIGSGVRIARNGSVITAYNIGVNVSVAWDAVCAISFGIEF